MLGRGMAADAADDGYADWPPTALATMSTLAGAPLAACFCVGESLVMIGGGGWLRLYGGFDEDRSPSSGDSADGESPDAPSATSRPGNAVSGPS
jgi:hypothetical protein